MPTPAAQQSSLCEGYGTRYSTGLHVGAIFVVLGASLLGVALPVIALYIPLLQRNPFVFVVAKTASTGVLIAVSSIHLLGDAEEMLREPCVSRRFLAQFPAWSILFAMVAAIAMHLVDSELGEAAETCLAKRNLRRQQRRQQERQEDEEDEEEEEAEAEAAPPAARAASHHRATDGAGGSRGSHESAAKREVLDALGDAGHPSFSPADPMTDEEAQRRPCCDSPHHAREASAARHHVESGDAVVKPGLPHCACPHPSAALTGPGAGISDHDRARRVVAAVSMEFGVALHSVFVGIDAGLATNARLRPLLVALVFHQLFEGMSMGSRLVSANFSLGLEAALCAVFAVSAPLGMVASTAAVSANPTAMSGQGFVLLLAVISAACAGILLYLAFHLLFVDFSADLQTYGGARGTRGYAVRKWSMYVALWIGFGIMALIGKWA